MAQYIDKDALVAEIERRIKEYQSTGDDYWFPVIENLKSILSFFDTFEVKEMDLDEEIKSYFKGFGKFPSVGIDDCIDIAKYFFELGLKAKQQ